MHTGAHNETQVLLYVAPQLVEHFAMSCPGDQDIAQG